MLIVGCRRLIIVTIAPEWHVLRHLWLPYNHGTLIPLLLFLGVVAWWDFWPSTDGNWEDCFSDSFQSKGWDGGWGARSLNLALRCQSQVQMRSTEEGASVVLPGSTD